MKTVAYQGVQGAFSYMTALTEFGEENIFKGAPTFKEVFQMVESGVADYAVIPIENSLIGSIYENYDLLNSYEMQIVGEHYTKIEQCLLAVPTPYEKKEKRLKEMQRVLSHPKALEQCSLFFQSHPWIEAVVYMDTAAAAAEVASKGDPRTGAIASAQAGALYGLEILEKGIEDDPKNYTRFVTLTKTEIYGDGVDKCSLLLQLKHLPGTLAAVLKHCADRELNLMKIASRPLRGTPFEYLFYIDLEFASGKQWAVEDLAKEISSRVEKIKILGFYKRGTLWIN